MHGGRTRLRQELEKQRLEQERRRDEEEIMKRREMAGIQQSSSIDVPPSMTTQSPVSVEVPHTVLEVRRCGWVLDRITPYPPPPAEVCVCNVNYPVLLHVVIYIIV